MPQRGDPSLCSKRRPETPNCSLIPFEPQTLNFPKPYTSSSPPSPSWSNLHDPHFEHVASCRQVPAGKIGAQGQSPGIRRPGTLNPDLASCLPPNIRPGRGGRRAAFKLSQTRTTCEPLGTTPLAGGATQTLFVIVVRVASTEGPISPPVFTLCHKLPLIGSVGKLTQ